MTIAYCHAPRFIHGAVRDIAPLAVKDSGRDSWCAKIAGATPLDQGQLEEVTARLVERLNENEALRHRLLELTIYARLMKENAAKETGRAAEIMHYSADCFAALLAATPAPGET